MQKNSYYCHQLSETVQDLKTNMSQTSLDNDLLLGSPHQITVDLEPIIDDRRKMVLTAVINNQK